MRKTRAAAYCRVSLAQQNSELQITNIKDFCGHRGFDLKSIYLDHGIGGSKESRPQLNQMIKDARLGKFDVLVVTGIDRLGRSTRHLLNLIHELSGYGVSLISLREAIDLTSVVGQATLAILSVVAQLEKELLRERIKSALHAKKLAAEKTGWRCGRPLLVTPELRTRVLELREKGLSIRQIGLTEDQARFKTKSLMTSYLISALSLLEPDVISMSGDRSFLSKRKWPPNLAKSN